MTDLESAAAEIVRDLVEACARQEPWTYTLHVSKPDLTPFVERIVALAQDYYVDTTAAVRREEAAARNHGILVENGRAVGWREMPPAARREHSPL